MLWWLLILLLIIGHNNKWMILNNIYYILRRKKKEKKMNEENNNKQHSWECKISSSTIFHRKLSCTTVRILLRWRRYCTPYTTIRSPSEKKLCFNFIINFLLDQPSPSDKRTKTRQQQQWRQWRTYQRSFALASKLSVHGCPQNRSLQWNSGLIGGSRIILEKTERQ